MSRAVLRPWPHALIRRLRRRRGTSPRPTDRGIRALPFILLALALAGCPEDVKDAFPKSVGYQPLTYCPQVEVAWPTDPVDPCPEVLSVTSAPGCGGELNPDKWVVTNHAHGRAYLKASLLAVWSTMQPTHQGDPNWIRLCKTGGGDDAWTVPGSQCADSWSWLPGEEPEFPVSFRMQYHKDEIISVDWVHVWRQGPLEGTVAAPLAVGARYQKTLGIENLRVQTTSYVLRPAPNDTCTSIEMVGWLDADRTDYTTVAGTLQNAYNLLKLGVHTP
ncbi:MAG TPA: hypothetical protein VFR85_02835 [Anaeromyxobacteraceae bacterium]|nr:hypothetical protein [Anaeromyxobacteraceae bacterium]